jgi:hypothetical protein
MNSATELIDWYWLEIDALRSSKSHHVLEDDGPCQCGTEEIIKDSSKPDQMRSFMMVGVLIDQIMWTHFYEMHSSFEIIFRYPKLNAHGSPGMASPSWFTYTRHGYDKKVNWTVVSDVAQILLNDLYQWFNREGKTDELSSFQERLKQEVIWEFELINKNQLISIIEKIEHKQT